MRKIIDFNEKDNKIFKNKDRPRGGIERFLRHSQK